jgi:hypothetical protein
VRRETAAAMIENAKLFDQWVRDGLIAPIDPDESVPLFDHEEVVAAYLRYRASKARK